MFKRIYLPLWLVLVVPSLGRAKEDESAPTHHASKWYNISDWFGNNEYSASDEAVEKVPAKAKTKHTPDRYFDRDGDGEYEVKEKFFDGNADGVNDTVATYTDTNEDGTYDTVSYRSTLAGDILGSANQEFSQEDLGKFTGRRTNVTGKVLETSVGGDKSTYSESLMKVQGDDGKETTVNLGNSENLQIFKGDKVSVWGSLVNDGEANVLVATEIESRGEEVQVVHHGSKYSGVVQSTQEVTVAGEKRLVAKIKTKAGKMFTVDLAQDQHADKIKQGQPIVVSGVPIDVKGRVVLLAIAVDFPADHKGDDAGKDHKASETKK